MLEELGPRQSLARGLVEQALQERFELGRHIVWELDGVLNNQVNQRVNTVCVERWRADEEFIDNDSKRPKIDRVIVW